MIKKTEKLVITFYTTTAAMAMEKVCKETGAEDGSSLFRAVFPQTAAWPGVQKTRVKMRCLR